MAGRLVKRDVYASRAINGAIEKVFNLDWMVEFEDDHYTDVDCIRLGVDQLNI